ncbi:Carboxypeptidase C (cathepsin A) [Phyllobacterium sp. YR620]|uniref:S10 family serine carboxypeptidase-like protein n=1 Tax=Phyllobacterium sp. YR620 TaxID=1881066 RepID=UPI000883D29F|nr:hypothetical protein [Phyllobacterium sp. YR620]SDP35752.1 Carboxypeptidase C (cathepsin A) [Phyllobacterium sp. YR620]
MNLKILYLFPLLGLAACDSSDNPAPASAAPAVEVSSAGTFEAAALPETTQAVTPQTPVAVAPETTVEVVPEVTEPVQPVPPAVTVDPGAAARAEAAELMKAGKPYEAVSVLKEAGLDEEAYALIAPADYAFHQEDHPATATAPVDETPSSMRHSMTINGKTVWFTAKAGHFIAYAPKDPKSPDKKDAKAAIFYMSYTRDDLPPENRPVTFLFNGGPGSSSVYLHTASWAPQRLKIDTPNIPKLAKDLKFPLLDNSETLLDQTDLVFVDPVGTGLSKAIAPHKNEEFYVADTDAAIVRDFVARYVNTNSRQSSPKYLYGESWGGSRIAFASALMEDAGISIYEPDPSGRPTKVLTGLVFNSPLLNGSSCYLFNLSGGCYLTLPTSAFTVDYLLGPAKSWRGNRTLEEYADYLRKFSEERFAPTYVKYNEKVQEPGTGGKSGKPLAYKPKTPEVIALVESTLTELRNIFGDPSMTADEAFTKYGDISIKVPGFGGGVYDTRLKADDYDVNEFDKKIFGDHISSRLPTYLNYFTDGKYLINCGCKFNLNRDPGGVVEITHALGRDPKLKMLVLHGYYDMSTPFFGSETTLKQAKLDKIIPVKLFEGGHMTYYTEAARGPMKKALDAFYMAQPATTVASQN